MKLLRDSLLVIGGAVAALVMQPMAAIGMQDSLRDHADNLIALSKLMQVDSRGNLSIRAGGVTLKADNLSVKARGNIQVASAGSLGLAATGRLKMTAGGSAELSGATTAVSGQASTRVKGAVLALEGSMTRIGSGRFAPALTMGAKILCAPSHSGVPPSCNIVSGASNVLIGN